MAGEESKKIALVFSGAVSLGSFEAGAACQLVRHMRERKEPLMEIDAIVGTSAGALTGAVLALVLKFGLRPEILEEAWLSVKLEDLLSLNKGDRSILSSSKAEELITRYIRPPEVTGRQSGMPGQIKLDIVVTNLDGLKYAIHRAKSGEFAIESIGYEDYFSFIIDDDFNDWDRLQFAVRASSAFPAAFEHTVMMRRDRESHYSDGGIVNNQPLNRAIDAVSELMNGNTGGESKRVFLVVDPSPPQEPRYREEYGVFDVLTKAVWTIPKHQTLYRDLRLVEKANRRISWKSSFLSVMADLFRTAEITEDMVSKMHQLCREIASFKGRTILGIDPEKYLENEERRIKQEYKAEIRKAANRDFFIKYCILLEQVADLRNKKEITLQMIRPQNPAKELAGIIFGSFGGFLDAEFMKHDFEVGRSYARRWLNQETDLYRTMAFRQYKMPADKKRRVLQKVLDNSLPLLVEDIAPRLMAGFGGVSFSTREKIVFSGMILRSFVKYLFRKTVKRETKLTIIKEIPMERGH